MTVSTANLLTDSNKPTDKGIQFASKYQRVGGAVRQFKKILIFAGVALTLFAFQNCGEDIDLEKYQKDLSSDDPDESEVPNNPPPGDPIDPPSNPPDNPTPPTENIETFNNPSFSFNGQTYFIYMYFDDVDNEVFQVNKGT